MTLEIREANLNEERDAEALLAVLDGYASAPSGGGVALSTDVKLRLVPALRAQAGALVLLAFEAEEVAGACTCFYGFSTFHARPLLNVHDLAVMPRFQRRGIGGALLAAAEARALAKGCCKLTLEVRQDNQPARDLYRGYGFRDFELAGVSYPTLFLAKPLRCP
jgi:ribosomal protein S18 acetylase RimI-like enzyme